MNNSTQTSLTSSQSKGLLSKLGLARRANKIVSGETLLAHIRQQKVFLVIIAEDASARTKKQLSNKCTFYNITYYISHSIAELSNAIGQKNRVAIGITEPGFVKLILNKKEAEVYDK